MKNNAVKNGLLFGGVTIFISLALYFFDKKMMFDMTIGLVLNMLILPIFFMIKAARDERKMNDGYLSFGEGLKTTFLTFAIGFFISSIFTYLMINVFDPSLKEVLYEKSMETAASMVEMFGGDADAIEEAKDQVSPDDIVPTLSVTFLNYLIYLIFPGFIYALIISAMNKKEDTSFAHVD